MKRKKYFQTYGRYRTNQPFFEKDIKERRRNRDLHLREPQRTSTNKFSPTPFFLIYNCIRGIVQNLSLLLFAFSGFRGKQLQYVRKKTDSLRISLATNIHYLIIICLSITDHKILIIKKLSIVTTRYKRLLGKYKMFIILTQCFPAKFAFWA